MAGKNVPSSAQPGCTQDATGKVGGHFHGRGGENLPKPGVGDPDGDGDNDRSPAGQADDRNSVAP
jgi:hypothetical protein